MLQPLDVSRLKLYDANPKVLQAFSNSSVEFICWDWERCTSKTWLDPVKAQNWVQQNIQPYLAQTKITCISVGNEVFMSNDTQMWSNLLPAMKTVYNTLVNLGIR
ncbi:hypothetical protein NC651_023392 [Populus alba x Populus x berolinensis]|nr:hypothetical protein NC651_023392 [Populus alba x Populus x berolinensis]